jgi:dimethylargininase
MDQCQRTYVARVPTDYSRAAREHEEYCRMLRKCGADVRTLEINRDSPDCAFIEDTTVGQDHVFAPTCHASRVF